MNLTRRILLFFIAALLLTACAAEPEIVEVEKIVEVEVLRDSNYASDAAPVGGVADFSGDLEYTSTAPDLTLDRGQLAQVNRLIIKSGNMSIEVGNIDASIDDATEFILGLGGYIVNQDVSGYDRYRNGNLTLGVPVESFETAMARFRELGTVNSESASGVDVTEEYVDLNARLTNLEATQQRLRALLNEAQNVEETLEVDRELRMIEGEINVLQGRIQYLSERAAFSTITLNLSATSDEPIGQPETWSLGPTIADASRDLVSSVQGLVDGLTYFSIAVLPFFAVLALCALIVWRIVRRIVARFQTTPVQVATAGGDVSTD